MPVTLISQGCKEEHTAPGPGSICRGSEDQPVRPKHRGESTYGKEQRDALVLEYLVDIFPSCTRLTNEIAIGLCIERHQSIEIETY